MTTRILILACHNFQQEVSASIRAEGWIDVSCAEFASRCGRPPIGWDEIRALLPADCGHVLILGHACVRGLSEVPADFPQTRIVPLAQCFHLVAGETLVNEAIASGSYLITAAWLADWRGQINDMGFNPERAGDFFSDFAKELLLLDTGIDPDVVTRLADLQKHTNLPVRRIVVGLDYTRLLLVRLVAECRYEEARREALESRQRHARELADHVAAMDMLVQLAKTQNEESAVAAIENLFHMLFAPAALHYIRVEKEVPIQRNPIPADVHAAMTRLRNDHGWTPDGQGFMLRIARGEELMGLIAVDRLAFPAYRERYLNMALALTGVCGLSIENARNRKKLLESEKMASLSILVAGVAHEINTPIGVGLLAASSMQQQVRQLGQKFAERRMSQSDLRHYLDTAEASTDLVRRNLERVGQLTDAFRKVAIQGDAMEKGSIRLNDCVSDVIRGMGDRLPTERITVRVECEPTLEIKSMPAAWFSIFDNLIVNSLKHGFKNRQNGIIDIRITANQKRVRVDYHDDGSGLSPEVQARIFDPFFTTDLPDSMGLGMHLVYNLITHGLGGSIQCESEQGSGVSFHIEAPIETGAEVKQ